eukprot:7549249-Lingulodinium_polyedra.AAC.1
MESQVCPHGCSVVEPYLREAGLVLWGGVPLALVGWKPEEVQCRGGHKVLLPKTAQQELWEYIFVLQWDSWQ